MTNTSKHPRDPAMGEWVGDLRERVKGLERLGERVARLEERTAHLATKVDLQEMENDILKGAWRAGIGMWSALFGAGGILVVAIKVLFF